MDWNENHSCRSREVSTTIQVGSHHRKRWMNSLARGKQPSQESQKSVCTTKKIVPWDVVRVYPWLDFAVRIAHAARGSSSKLHDHTTYYYFLLDIHCFSSKRSRDSDCKTTVEIRKCEWSKALDARSSLLRVAFVILAIMYYRQSWVVLICYHLDFGRKQK